jgi:predicted dehydrogenase
MKASNASRSRVKAAATRRTAPGSREARFSRRKFMLASGAAAAFSIVPRHVLGGPGFVPPSEKITLAYIGCGTQGLREMVDLLAVPEIQIVAVCDPMKDGHNYLDWSADGLRADIAQAMGKPDWRRGAPGVPGGRDVGKELVEGFYANQRSSEKFNGCATFADFRELLDQQKDINAVKIMTPDHLHATISVAAMKKGKHVMMHKPLANRVQEARWVIETARQTGVATHFLAANDGADIRTIKDWIDNDAIGTLREIHNWSNRPVWPQYATIPKDTPPVPADFDWSLWLGPCADRPYHPHYTNMVFRGWYDFGGGSLADMGHYSLWPVFKIFDLDSPISVESRPSHACALNRSVAITVKNDYSFPDACVIRFKFAGKGSRPPIDLFWHDGSMKPPTPEELESSGQDLAPEGMMFIGDKGKILADFRGEDPQIIPAQKMRDFLTAKNRTAPAPSPRDGKGQRRMTDLWVAACKGGPATPGNFLFGQPISDAFNLAAISLRLGGKKLVFDSSAMRITNIPEANRYLTREYRKGWELSV